MDGGIGRTPVAPAPDETTRRLIEKLRRDYSADPLGLHHELDLSNWQIDTEIAADSFTSEKAKTAQPMAFNRPANASAPPGLKPLMNMKSSKAAPAQPVAKSP